MKPHRGVLILVLGILSFLTCGIITAIPAWIMGHGDLKEMDAGTMDPTGRGLTQAGKILGMIHCILLILVVVAFIVLFALGILGSLISKQQ
jgi:Domain of unknown function (DUF4190)